MKSYTAWQIAGNPDLFYQSFHYQGQVWECMGVSRGEQTVRFARLISTPDGRLKQINIYVKPDAIFTQGADNVNQS